MSVSYPLRIWAWQRMKDSWSNLERLVERSFGGSRVVYPEHDEGSGMLNNGGAAR
jgi:hypothetical protein